MNEFPIVILTKSKSDLSKLHFKEFDILNINSIEFIEFYKTSKTTDKIKKEIEDELIFDNSERFAIIRKNKTKNFGIKRIYDLYNFLLVLFPSSLQIEYIIRYQISENNIQFVNSFKTGYRRYQSKNLLFYNEKNITEINNFIDDYYDDYLKINYIKFAIQHYWNAFDTNYYHFSFLAFCISLESIIEAKSELLYKLTRSVAIISGKDRKSSEIIFNNIKKIYNLRSSIVHGADFDDELVSEYLEYLENIVSKTIIQLLIHGIENVKILNNTITKIGFGDCEKISNNWKEFNFNTNQEKIILADLPKKISYNG